MNVEWEELAIPGVLLSHGGRTQDERGSFSKVLGGGAPFSVAEVCWSTSAQGVVRGMHFQTPPRAQEKFVFVLNGAIRDLVVDLRVGSPTQGRLIEVDLTPDTGGVLVPVGCGHGFESLQACSTVVYLLSTGFHTDSDAGVSLASVGFMARSSRPLLSERDGELPDIADYPSPFAFGPSL